MDCQLRSIIYHSGTNPLSGHYIALVCHETSEGAQFFIYNDATRLRYEHEEIFTRLNVFIDAFHATIVLYEKVWLPDPSVRVRGVGRMAVTHRRIVRLVEWL